MRSEYLLIVNILILVLFFDSPRIEESSPVFYFIIHFNKSY